jgi:amino acid adenylation domain-containing protein/thioester reductase-like protein
MAMLMSDEEYEAVVHKYNSRIDESLIGRRLDNVFEGIATDYPDNIALIHNDDELTYEGLNVAANLFARGLEKWGLRRGDVVGLAVSRSFDLVIVILAILKLGAAYVPIDPVFPAQRINNMVEDAGLRLILINEVITIGLAELESLCVDVTKIKDETITDSSNLNADIHHRDLAYIIYTSGSTGRPKGVEISHGAASNFLLSLRQFEPGCSIKDRLLAITTISFDMSTLELYLPIVSGATMIIANTGAVKDPREMISLMRDHKATILQATPATWSMLLDAGWKGEPRLSKVICGGEPLTRNLADRLLASADSVWNVYGPSETTYGSVGKVTKDDIVVGNPMINGRIYVLDDDLRPVPVGVEGEVYIGGSSVSNGYRNKSELTRSRFLKNPFHHGIFFRTGDLARFLAPGKLQVIGRIDGVVKIRGHRIDVGDIEAVLVQHVSVSAAVVIGREDRLVAYCVVSDSSSYDATSLDRMLRPWVAERLPSYMLPAFFVPMSALPLSPNEKVNRKALPDPLEAMRQSNFSTQTTSKMEQRLHTLWSKVLGHDRYGIDDSFFSVGGDSVRLIRVQALLENELQCIVPVPKLFEHFTIKTLAKFLVTMSGVEEKGEEPRARASSRSDGDERFAVVSMACRLPGGVNTPDGLWDVLLNGEDMTSDIPRDRWDADRIYHANPDIDGTSYCRRGGFVDSVSAFDASFFGISPREAKEMDPEQHIMLELCWESFERAGYTREKLNGSATGVVIGVSKNRASRNDSPAEFKGYSITGSADATLSGRLSYTYNLRGPSMTIDTACSSSLVALHLACNALRERECENALVGGVSLLLSSGIHIEFSKLRGLSTDGRCRAFSEDTDGTGFSEGAAMIMIKRLSDALRDGDRIHAVLRGTAVMHGGRGVSLTAPNGPGQENLIRMALEKSQLEPNDIDYVEAHGTATKLGDPIELAALAGVFGKGYDRTSPLWLGSAKSNFGHTQAAAGLVGLLKVVLAMQNDVLPKTLHVREPTKVVDWKSSNMELVLENRPWIPGKAHVRRAGVSAFGIGGTIAHVIVEEHKRTNTENAVDDQDKISLPAAMILISAESELALRSQAERLRSHIEGRCSGNELILDWSYSLATSRTHLRRRLAMMAENKEQLLDQLALLSSGQRELSRVNDAENAVVGMLFTGQGSQRLQMGKSLYSIFPQFQESLDMIASQFMELEHPLLDVIWAEPESPMATLLSRTEYSQPALFALEVSLYALWQSWGVQADFLLGHSVGELAVAHVAGILDLADACRLVYMRGRLMQTADQSGRMAVLATDSKNANVAIEGLGLIGKVHIAGYNAPSQTVISGDSGAVEVLEAHFATLGVKTKLLETSHAFHSHHMDGMLDTFRATAKTLKFSPPLIPIVSSLTGRLAVPGELEQADYWVQQVRNAVRFQDAFESVVDQGANVFIEIGPSPILCGLGATCLTNPDQSASVLWLPSLKDSTDESQVIQESLGRLHTRGVSIDWNAYYKPFGCKRVDLPTYAFQRTMTLPSSEISWPNGILTPSESSDATQDWRNMMFEMIWSDAKLEEGKFRLGSSWGVLRVSEPTIWTSEAESTLSDTHIRLKTLDNIREAQTEHHDGLLVLWDSASDVVKSAHDLTAKALKLLQEASQCGLRTPMIWVTRHALGVRDGDHPLQIGAAPLVGLLRTARSEHPELNLHLIDIDESSRLKDLATALVVNGPVELAIRDGKLLAPRMLRAEPKMTAARKNNQQILRRSGAVLVTGGLGDLGSRTAQRLVETHGARDLVLLSRRGRKSPESEAIVSRLEKLGASVTIVACDVAEIGGLDALMGMFTSERPLRGIVHAAGSTDPGTLSTLTIEKCASTFTPKVDGLWNLHQASKDMDLDFFIMFSSISGVMGLPGLGNYAAANAFIDSLAYLRQAQGLPATSLAFGTWAGDGMATTLEHSTRTHLSQLGLGFLDPEVGLDLLEEAVVQGRALSIPADLDLSRMKTYFEDQGGIPYFLRSILDGGVQAIDAVKPLSLREMLAQAVLGDHGAIVLRMVQKTVAKALEHANGEALDATRPLQDFGIDSLTAVLVRNHLTTLTGLALPPNVVLLYPTLKALSTHLQHRLREDIRENSTRGLATQVVDMSTIRKGLLDPKIQFKDVSKAVSSEFRCPETAFVTGPTGFVGAFMVYEFLKRGIQVYCLVRAQTSSLAQDRMVATLTMYGLWKPHFGPLLHPVIGDLSKPMFGIDDSQFSALADRIDCILHSGALVDWMRPLEDYIGPNVLGTHEVLRLASRGRPKAVHFISTISTLPIHLGYGLGEDDAEYGYGTSKYLAERMIVGARFRGAATFSYRLPFVAASSTDGQFRRDQGDFLNNLITGSLDIKAFPSLDADLSAVLPVDYLCGVIADMMTTKQQQAGEDYDFVNPLAQKFDDFLGMMSVASGGSEILPFSEWHRRALAYATAHPGSSLARITAVLDGYTDQTAGSLMKGSPVGNYVFGRDSYPAPALDAEYAQKYVERIRISKGMCAT